MERLVDNYMVIVREYDKSLTEASTQFFRNLEACEMNHRSKTKNIINLLNVLMRDSEGDEDESSESTPCISKTFLTVPTWWEIFVQERYPDEKCLENFKCSRRTYFYLIKALRLYIRPRLGATQQRRALNMVKGVSVEKQVAIMLYKLAVCSDYSLVSAMFGVHKSTVHKILYKAIRAVNKHLLKQIIRMPSDKEASRIAERTERKFGIPQIIGAIESTHIPVYPSAHMVNIFTNSKNYPSFVAQTIVDSHHCFRDVSVRHPGSAETNSILQDSSIYKYSNRAIPKGTRSINDTEIPYKIVGSTSYPLLPWLLTGYKSPSCQSEILFNARLHQIQNYSTAALDKLKARYIILSQSIDVSFKLAPQILAACCVLHNICEESGDPFLEDWLTTAKRLREKFPQPEKIDDTREVEQILLGQRNAIRDYLEERILSVDVAEENQSV